MSTEDPPPTYADQTVIDSLAESLAAAEAELAEAEETVAALRKKIVAVKKAHALLTGQEASGMTEAQREKDRQRLRERRARQRAEREAGTA